MALDPEELKRRRELRQRQRENRKRSMIVRLIVAGIALALCATLIVALTVGKKQKPGNSGDQNVSSAEGTVASTGPAPTVIRFAAAGDLNINEAVVNSGGGNYDYMATLMDVAHLLADADITALNFEGNLYGAPYGTDRSAPQALPEALAAAGVDLVQLANSYSIYKGMDGLKQTISGIRVAGMQPLGVFADTAEAQAAKGYTVCSVQGIKIAFVAFTKGMDGMALPPGNEGCVNLLYTDYSTDYQNVDTEVKNGTEH